MVPEKHDRPLTVRPEPMPRMHVLISRVRSGLDPATAVEAISTDAPSSTKDTRSKRDPDRYRTTSGHGPYFGMNPPS